MPGPATTVSTGTVAGITLANILSSQLFGIQVALMGEALLITVLGVFGRLGYEVLSSLRANGSVRWTTVFGLSAAGLISALSITIVVLALLKAVGIVDNNVTLLCLFFFGYLGPEGFPWLFNLATSTIKKRTGLSLPEVQPNATPKP